MTIQGYQFDKIKVTPESDAALYSYLAQNSDNKVIKGATATASGLNIYVSTGKALVQGRLIEITQQHQLSAQSNTTGYVVITVDLTQSNTATGTPGTSSYIAVNNQLKMELVETLTQQDLSDGGLIYTFPLYSYVSTGTSITLTKIKSSYPTDVITLTGVSMGYGATATIIRDGNRVDVTMTGSYAGGTGYHALNELFPLGFRPTKTWGIATVGMIAGQGGVTPVGWLINQTGVMSCAGGVSAGNTLILNGSASWYTTDPFP